MRIAVIGAGISGLMCSWLLSRRHRVSLFEANDYLGGHTHTHDIALGGRRYRVDTGFIVYSPLHYPLLTRLFAELRVESQPTTMSFSVRNEATGLEYNATSLAGMFCQRRNLVSPRFLGMIRDLVRFYREAPALLELDDAGPTLGEYLRDGRYGAAFRDDHLVPMASALWSSPPGEILSFPARYLVRFMANHQMLNAQKRPVWRVVAGGSDTYVGGAALALVGRGAPELPGPQGRSGRTVGADRHRRGCRSRSTRWCSPVTAIRHWRCSTMLPPPSARCWVPCAIRSTTRCLHTDADVLPRNPRAWAAWNALVPRVATQTCTVSYCMNLLQGLSSPDPLIVTLNPIRPIDPRATLKKLRYHHPVYSHGSVAAQARKPDIQGKRRTWYAGAYWGWGFHEDGMRSAVEVASALDAPWELAPAAEDLAA